MRGVYGNSYKRVGVLMSKISNLQHKKTNKTHLKTHIKHIETRQYTTCCCSYVRKITYQLNPDNHV